MRRRQRYATRIKELESKGIHELTASEHLEWQALTGSKPKIQTETQVSYNKDGSVEQIYVGPPEQTSEILVGEKPKPRTRKTKALKRH